MSFSLPMSTFDGHKHLQGELASFLPMKGLASGQAAIAPSFLDDRPATRGLRELQEPVSRGFQPLPATSGLEEVIPEILETWLCCFSFGVSMLNYSRPVIWIIWMFFSFGFLPAAKERLFEVILASQVDPQRAFEVLDRDNDGVIAFADLVALLRHLGFLAFTVTPLIHLIIKSVCSWLLNAILNTLGVTKYKPFKDFVFFLRFSSYEIRGLPLSQELLQMSSAGFLKEVDFIRHFYSWLESQPAGGPPGPPGPPSGAPGAGRFEDLASAHGETRQVTRSGCEKFQIGFS